MSADERRERAQLINERLARAFQQTCEKRHLSGSCVAMTILRDDREYSVPVFEWKSLVYCTADDYNRLVANIIAYIDGEIEIDEVKPSWTAYLLAALHNPVFDLPDEPTVIGPLDQHLPVEERRHHLLFNKRDSHGSEVVQYYEGKEVDALDLLRWFCAGYTHIKLHGEGDWREIRMPAHHEVETAREIRGEATKARKRMSGANQDDERAKGKASHTVVIDGPVTLDKLRAIRDEEERVLISKGRKIKRPKGRAVRPKKAATTKRKAAKTK